MLQHGLLLYSTALSCAESASASAPKFAVSFASLNSRFGRGPILIGGKNKTFASSTTQNPGAYTKRISGEGSAGLGYTKRRAEVAVSKTTKETRRSKREFYTSRQIVTSSNFVVVKSKTKAEDWERYEIVQN